MVVPKVKAGPSDYEVIAQDPLKHVVTVIEKKVRNLDKRKVKLDVYKKKVSDGLTLDPDQKAAADKYDEVIGSLDFAKELLKMLEVTMTEVSKVQRKAMRREHMVQEDKENYRIAFITKATRIMDVIYQNKSIQEDFLNGANGACTLSQTELKLLMDFFQLFLAPSYESGTNIIDESSTAANHLYELVEARTKSIMGTTYKELHGLIEKLSGLEYFEDLQFQTEDQNEQAPAKETRFEEESSSSLEDEEEEKEAPEEIQNEDAAADNTQQIESSEISETISSPTDFTEETEFLKSKSFEASSLRSNQAQVESHEWVNAAPNANEQMPNQDISHTMTFQYSDQSESEAVEPAKALPSIQDVLAEVQGHCEFLQDSMIDAPSLSFVTQQQPQMQSHGIETIAFQSEINHVNNNINNTANSQSQLSNTPPTIVQNVELTNQTFGISHDTLHGSQQQSRSSSISPTVQKNLTENSGNYISQTQNDMSQDNLGMGQTTFGSQQNMDHSQYSSENTNSYLQEGKNYSPYESTNQTNQQSQYDHASPIMSSEIAPDPPTSHIPLPNDHQSGYTSYQPSVENEDMTRRDEQGYSGLQKKYSETNNGGDSEPMQKYNSINHDDIQQQNYDNGNIDADGSYGNSRQTNDNSRNMSNQSRSRGYNGQGNYRSNSGQMQGQQQGGYRNNNYRANRYNNGSYDSMGRPSNYHNGGYHGNGGQGGYNNYRGNQDMYMQRRGNSGGGYRGRGGYGGGQRGNYGRSRTFNRPQHANEQHVN